MYNKICITRYVPRKKLKQKMQKSLYHLSNWSDLRNVTPMNLYATGQNRRVQYNGTIWELWRDPGDVYVT